MDIIKIRAAVNDGISIEYSAHCLKRMLERDIGRRDIFNCLYNGEIIEDYPLEEGNVSDKSLPSCLILGEKIDDKKPIHVVVGFNGKRILIISACYPDLQYWNNDLRTRR